MTQRAVHVWHRQQIPQVVKEQVAYVEWDVTCTGNLEAGCRQSSPFINASYTVKPCFFKTAEMK
jgi:hypothetical protein